jgi:hypothetical protein
MIIDKFKIDSFQLMSGAPIHIPSLDLFIHQPKLHEIALIGEEQFYKSLSYFKIKKDLILNIIQDESERANFAHLTDYDALKIVINNEPEIEKDMTMIFRLIIKELRSIRFNDGFLFISTESGQQYIINDESFSVIKGIIYQIFNLEDKEKEFNPGSKAAEEMVNKIQERRRRLSELQGKKDQSVLGDFVSILAIGLKSLDINTILNLTLYQIFNIMKRFGMYNQYNIQIQALMQGAEDVELIDWLQKI